MLDPSRLARAARVGLGAGLAIAVCSAVALWTELPWVFPSLGPTAFLAFAAPAAPANHPRRVLVGHAIAVVCGAVAVRLFDVADIPAVLTQFDLPHLGAVTLALAATAAFAVLLDAEHAPAGATTLIVALGFIRHPRDLVLIEAAVLVLVLVCAALRRLGLIRPETAGPSGHVR
ncbi:HPP family protein [Nannocystis sp. SCPEA4]|uniref:HPP family protein n=1 Tax=Nannocystis sp. SCPEA4 TaxID=2996787 RepID=UPI002270D564|nr:HPP family protein [Nannocystis sp. SCPEA4]